MKTWSTKTLHDLVEYSGATRQPLRSHTASTLNENNNNGCSRQSSLLANQANASCMSRVAFTFPVDLIKEENPVKSVLWKTYVSCQKAEG